MLFRRVPWLREALDWHCGSLHHNWLLGEVLAGPTISIFHMLFCAGEKGTLLCLNGKLPIPWTGLTCIAVSNLYCFIMEAFCVLTLGPSKSSVAENLTFCQFFLGNSGVTKTLPHLHLSNPDRPLSSCHLSLNSRLLLCFRHPLHAGFSHLVSPSYFLLHEDLAPPQDSAKLLKLRTSQCLLNLAPLWASGKHCPLRHCDLGITHSFPQF